MGLCTSHDAWDGAYSAFHRWRREITRAALGIDLDSMEGFSEGGRSWSDHAADPLVKLLHHSDCDGEIAAADCGPIADRLESLLPRLEVNLGGHVGCARDKTEKFIAGLGCSAAWLAYGTERSS